MKRPAVSLLVSKALLMPPFLPNVNTTSDPRIKGVWNIPACFTPVPVTAHDTTGQSSVNLMDCRTVTSRDALQGKCHLISFENANLANQAGCRELHESDIRVWLESHTMFLTKE